MNRVKRVRELSNDAQYGARKWQEFDCAHLASVNSAQLASVNNAQVTSVNSAQVASVNSLQLSTTMQTRECATSRIAAG